MSNQTEKISLEQEQQVPAPKKMKTVTKTISKYFI